MQKGAKQSYLPNALSQFSWGMPKGLPAVHSLRGLFGAVNPPAFPQFQRGVAVRTTKRFTPDVLARFRREGRGSGSFESYLPWHRVGRGDPSSRGRSHLIPWRGRPIELLSDLEWVVFLFLLMFQRSIVDVREQFPLALNERRHELAPYDVAFGRKPYPGTLALALALNIKHPVLRRGHPAYPWVLSTDLLITLRAPSGRSSLLAIACKFDSDLSARRTRELLSLEREYWCRRGVDWLLITPGLFDKRVALTLRRTTPWILGEKAPSAHIQEAARTVMRLSQQPYAQVIRQLSGRLGGDHLAQSAFWQAAWAGVVPLDLRRSWRPHSSIHLLSEHEFLLLNPVASRRSAWI